MLEWQEMMFCTLINDIHISYISVLLKKKLMQYGMPIFLYNLFILLKQKIIYF